MSIEKKREMTKRRKKETVLSTGQGKERKNNVSGILLLQANENVQVIIPEFADNSCFIYLF